MWPSSSQVTPSCCLGKGEIWDTIQALQSRGFFHCCQKERNPHHVSSRQHCQADIWSSIRGFYQSRISANLYIGLTTACWVLLLQHNIAVCMKKNKLLGHVSWVQCFFPVSMLSFVWRPTDSAAFRLTWREKDELRHSLTVEYIWSVPFIWSTGQFYTLHIFAVLGLYH